jgi:hypothetical protein
MGMPTKPEKSCCSSSLLYIKVYVERGASESILDPRIEMPRTTKDEVVSAHMADELKLAKGDPIATIDVMMKGYNTQYKNAKKDLMKLVKSIENIAAVARDATDDDQDEAEEHAHAIVITAIRNETQKSNITEFAALVDNKYRQKLEKCVDWSVATSYLLSDNDVMDMYNEFHRRFPPLYQLDITVCLFRCSVSKRIMKQTIPMMTTIKSLMRRSCTRNNA